MAIFSVMEAASIALCRIIAVSEAVAKALMVPTHPESTVS
jgi:hypothetical protein